MSRDWDKYIEEVRAVSKTRTYMDAFENAGKFIQDNYQYMHSDYEYDYFKNPVAHQLEKKNIQIKY